MKSKYIMKNVFVSVLIVLCYILIKHISGHIWSAIFVDADKSYYYLSFAKNLCALIFIFLVLIAKKKVYILKERGAGLLEGLKVGGFLVIFLSISLIGNIICGISDGYQSLPLNQITWFVLDVFLGIGMAEELVFRGMLQNLMYDCFGKDSKKSIFLSIIISGFIFGVAHLSNIVSGGEVFGVFMQALGAFAIGIYFGAIYARCNNIWVLILIHGYNDFVLLMDSGIWGRGNVIDSISTYGAEKVVGVVLYIWLACFLLRKRIKIVK